MADVYAVWMFAGIVLSTIAAVAVWTILVGVLVTRTRNRYHHRHHRHAR